ncbi:AMP-binding protein [Micromonospora andamanensis]|uniref:Long-chain acyl-CoA synthetase n=1 Tax=Micromonospora andamanensis TaxID=1287068 RepID=A0ABQ4HTI2_9ACTN|nr:AMP-binding protein [Micromonospora andamanensis]GIJ08938.1 long-chain acyl-CoA synthetase [Micromonospora andamanensis]
MAELFIDLASRTPAATALVDERGSTTWRELNDRVNGWIEVLRGHGVAAGDAVAVMAGNRRETFEMVLAGLHAGMTVVPVNWHLTAAEVAYILTDAGCRLLVVDAQRAAVAADAVARCGGPPPLTIDDLAPVPDAAEPTDQLCGALLLYTSGSTGRPRGVANRLFVAGAPFSRVGRLGDYAARTLRLPAEGRTLVVAPWYHSAQLFFALLPLLRGSTLVIEERFDPVRTLSTMARHRVTTAHLVPTHFVRLLALDPAVRDQLTPADLRLVWHGGGPCPVDVKDRMIAWWGPVLLEYYGATESGAITVIDSIEAGQRPGSVGRAVPPHEIVILDPAGRPLPAGRTGTVYVRRTGGSGFHYHNAPAATAAAHREPDLFTVGEVGHLDDAGYLFLTGRARDVVVTGGVNVHAAEVEAVLLRHPEVRDAAVVGVPDEEYGERVVAVVVAAEPDRADELPGRLDRHTRETLAGFKAPRAYRLVDALPRDDTGKLRKQLVRRMLAELPGGGA